MLINVFYIFFVKLTKNKIFLLGEDTPLHNACQNNHLDVALYVNLYTLFILLYFKFSIKVNQKKS